MTSPFLDSSDSEAMWDKLGITYRPEVMINFGANLVMSIANKDAVAASNEYVHEFRPALLRGTNAPWLFPGEAGQPKNRLMFSKRITDRIQKEIGLRVTVHQFRHAAAAIYLKHHPGDYRTVQRVLGHRSVETTINFYCGLETMQATEDFGKLIRQQIKFDPTNA